MRLNYDEISPFTNKKTILIEYDENAEQNMRLCMTTGYHTFDSWKSDSEEVIRFEMSSIDDVNDLRKDVTGQAWYPILLINREFVLKPETFPTEYEQKLKYQWDWKLYRLIESTDESSIIRVLDDNGETIAALDETPIQTWEADQFELAYLKFHELCSTHDFSEN